MNTYIVNILVILASIGLVAGPALLVLRWNVASPVEVFLNIGSTFAVGLIVLTWFYFAGAKANAKQSLAGVQEELARLRSLRKAIALYVVTMGSLVILALGLWLTSK